ncbi:MAG TPA: hypothetical protein VHQ04_06495, partial [Puia sp.]|nr:hypothetical protein [Puia sp.]
MFRKQISVCLFFTFIALAGFSNASLFPGYYVNQKGDTIRCKIEFNDWNLNPGSVKIQVGDKRMEFTPNDIKGFGVDGYDDYISATVQTHTAPVAGKDVPTQFSDSVTTNTYFLKILNRGFYSLYNLVSTERVYLFYQMKDSSVHELVYRTKASNDSLFVDQQYKNVLLSFFVQEGISDKYFNRVGNTSYNASDVQSLFNILNDSHGGYSYHKKAKQEFQIQLYAGAIRNSFPTPVTGSYGTIHHFDPSTSVTGGINFLYAIPGKFNAFKFGLSAGYNSYNCERSEHNTGSFYQSDNWHSTVDFNDTLTTKNSLIQTNFYVMYVVNPLSSVKCFLKAGISYNFSLNSDNSVDERNAGTSVSVTNGNPPVQSNFKNSNSNLVILKKSYLAPVFGAGMVYGRNTLEF